MLRVLDFLEDEALEVLADALVAGAPPEVGGLAERSHPTPPAALVLEALFHDLPHPRLLRPVVGSPNPTQSAMYTYAVMLHVRAVMRVRSGCVCVCSDAGRYRDRVLLKATM